MKNNIKSIKPKPIDEKALNPNQLLLIKGGTGTSIPPIPKPSAIGIEDIVGL